MFFFFKQKTAYEMRISDWSSDVCSSDLDRRRLPGRGAYRGVRAEGHRQGARGGSVSRRRRLGRVRGRGSARKEARGGSTDRKSVVSGKSVSVRVDLGGRRSITKKKQSITQYTLDSEKLKNKKQIY